MAPITLTTRPISPTGYGLMGLTWRASPPPTAQSLKTMQTALSLGANLWNGGEFYGPPHANSLQLLNTYFKTYPEDAEKVVLSIKGGANAKGLPDGSEENTRRSIEECLKVLDGVKKLDIWEPARVDPGTPVEVTMRAAKKYVDAGKIGGVGLSECSAATIRRAAKIVKIEAVEVEFSLWETEILRNGVAATCAELGIPIVAYSPLGRGFLTGQIRKFEDLPEDDMRRHFPRFQPDVFEGNMKLVEELEGIAKRKGCTSGQVGLAWVRAQSGRNGNPVFIPIPGATTEERVKENMVEVKLSEGEMEEIEALLKSATVAGGRYPGHIEALNFGDSPEEE